MVKQLAKLLGYFVFLMIAIMYFTPKVNIYYLLEKELKIKGVIISKEIAKDTGYNLVINNLDISYKEIDSVKIADVTFNIFALYNKIDVVNVQLAGALSAFFPVNIENISIVYTLLNPLNITAMAKGDFGDAHLVFSLTDFTLHVDLIPSKIMHQSHRNTLSNLVKTENGEYTYDKSF